jgi:hypothetical protein
MEAFLAKIMDENPTGGDLMDDEYYLFGGEERYNSPRNIVFSFPVFNI